jgi:hypothetical protein
MARRRKTWREKLYESEGLPKIVDIPPRWTGRFGSGKMLIARPLDVDALIREVREGKLVTQDQIRERLARDFGVDATCPLTTGIFVRIVAEVAEEDFSEGKEEVTPYWRVLKADGGLNPKLPGGVELQAARLEAEGHTIEPARGKRPPRVKDFLNSLARL